MEHDTRKLEEQYQAAQKHWKEHGDKQSWDTMWLLVHNCCTAIAKRKANGVGKTVPQLDEKITDAAIMVMRDIKDKGRLINKLSSYCYMRVFATMYARKTQEWERLLSLEEYNERKRP